MADLRGLIRDHGNRTSIPLLDDIPLTAIQSMEHMLDAGFIPTSVAGLDGQVQQRLHRPSHKIHITGILEGETKLDDLATLQEAAASGEEITLLPTL